MSLFSAITDFISNNALISNIADNDENISKDDNDDNKKGKNSKKPKPISIAVLKKDPAIKNLSQYVRGGISKMTKPEIDNFISAIRSYKKDVYRIKGRLIEPDAEQMMIINSPTMCNIRVIAGAGTGKTTTITCRVKKLIDYCVTPDKILILTFNVESRKNLEDMIDGIIGFEAKVEIRTIDSFCLKLKNTFWPDLLGSSTGSSTERQNINRSLSEYGVIGRKIMEKYGHEVSAQYKYVFFDEFQDVDEDQFEILRIMAHNGCFLTVIGDDSQNIYQFRGSDNFYLINFDKIIKNVKTYKITTNYRSIEQIVNLANESIQNNKDKIHKVMKHATTETGCAILSITDDQNELINFIVNKITYYVDTLGYGYNDIACLSRITLPLKHLETEFERLGIPYVALITDQYSSEYKQIIQEHKIVLSTIHKAKGLEWKVVIMIGIADVCFPSHTNNGLQNIEEERRLFYVGSTRAKRHLHYVAKFSDMPLSRFLGEVSNYFDTETLTKKKIDDSAMFLGCDDNRITQSYSVSKIIEMINGRRIEELRNMLLIPDTATEIKQIFIEPLDFTDQIKKNVLESDYSIYCNYYMIRQLMIMNAQKIRDMNAESILLNLTMTYDERLIYNSYDIRTCLIKEIPPKIDKIDKKLADKITKLYEKLNKVIKHANLSPHDIEYLLAVGVSNYEYPRKFISSLDKAYAIYVNPEKSTIDRTILNSIYYTSLCARLIDNRRRLVYRDIHDMYADNSITVLPRIDEYVKHISNDKILCKIRMSKLFKIDKHKISLYGEIDYIDISNNTIVDIKCSESEFKVEWLIQLLLYYSLFKATPGCCDNYDNIVIEKLAIINIFTGKYYSVDIPDDYMWEKMLDYIKDIITKSIKGIRDKADLTKYNEDIEMNDSYTELEYTIENGDDKFEVVEVPQQMIILKTFDEISGYVVVDVENNTITGDIIQLAYMVCTDAGKITKKRDFYIKDRVVDARASEITGITTDILREKGVDFKDAIHEFCQDILKVNTMCGHCVHTDIAKIKRNIKKYNIVPSIDSGESIDPFKEIKYDDTLTMYKQLMGPSAKKGALQNVYLELFKKEMVDAHDAMSDVRHTNLCYIELKKRLLDKETDDIPEDKKPIKKPIAVKRIFKSKLVTGDGEQCATPMPKKETKKIAIKVKKTEYTTQIIEPSNDINNTKNKKSFTLDQLVKGV